MQKFKTVYLGVASKLFFSDFLRTCNTNDEQFSYDELENLIRERIDSDIDGINPYFSWDYNSLKRKEFLRKYFTEYIRQLKDRVKLI
jgi:hypothetical protein